MNDETPISYNHTAQRMKAICPKGIGAIKYKEGKQTIVSAILDIANLQGNVDEEARKVVNYLRTEGTGWNPSRISITKVKASMQRIKDRLLQGEKIVPKEQRMGQVRKEYRRRKVYPMREAIKTAQDVTHQSSPYSLPNTGLNLSTLVSQIKDLRTALEMVLEQVNKILE